VRRAARLYSGRRRQGPIGSCRSVWGGSTLITSPANPRIKEARKLQRRRARYAQRQLLLEGVRLVRDALHAGVTPHVVFYVPAMADNPAAADLLTDLARRGVETVPCSAQVFATLAETETPQGIAAVLPLPRLAAPPPGARTLSLLLDQVRDPGNAGTLLRSAAAAGVELVIFAPGTVDPYNEKALRAGMGAHFRLPLLMCDTWEAVEATLDPRQQLYLAETGAAQLYDQVDWTAPVALIIGGEAAGAGAVARRRAQPVAIPMARATESLNAAVAGAVILFEAARQRRMASIAGLTGTIR
jgi:TrmH family RNA methyltransferase